MATIDDVIVDLVLIDGGTTVQITKQNGDVLLISIARTIDWVETDPLSISYVLNKPTNTTVQDEAERDSNTYQITSTVTYPSGKVEMWSGSEWVELHPADANYVIIPDFVEGNTYNTNDVVCFYDTSGNPLGWFRSTVDNNTTITPTLNWEKVTIDDMFSFIPNLNEPILASDIMAMYRFQDNLNDSSENENDLDYNTTVPLVYDSGKSGLGVSLDGASTTIALSKEYNGTMIGTITGWFKQDTTVRDGNNYLVDTRFNGTGGWCAILEPDHTWVIDDISLDVFVNGVQVVDGDTAPTLGEYFHVTVRAKDTYESSKMFLGFASVEDGNIYTWNGQIDEVTVYLSKLTDSQIQTSIDSLVLEYYVELRESVNVGFNILNSYGELLKVSIPDEDPNWEDVLNTPIITSLPAIVETPPSTNTISFSDISALPTPYSVGDTAIDNGQLQVFTCNGVWRKITNENAYYIRRQQ